MFTLQDVCCCGSYAGSEHAPGFALLVLVSENVALCLSFPKSRLGCDSLKCMMQECWLLEGCAALGIFDPVTAGETQTFPESDPSTILLHFICLLWPGKRGSVSPGTHGLWQSPGAAACTRAASLGEAPVFIYLFIT